MNLEPYRALLADLERDRELAEALEALADCRRMVAKLDVAIANYQDARASRSES